MAITYTPTPKEQAGLDAATAAYNTEHAADEGFTALTSDQYIAQRLSEVLVGWADAFQCGAIPVGEFIRRFTGAEIDTLKALAVSDPVVAGFMSQLDTAPQGKVWLLSDTIAQAKAYLLSKGFDATRVATIFAVS